MLALLSILLGLGLVPAGADSEQPRPRGVAAWLGLQAIARMGERGQVASDAGEASGVPTVWQARAPAPSRRVGGTLTYVRDSAGNHNLWYIGGITDTLGTASGEVDKYNALLNVWTANVSAMPMPAGGHCAVAAGKTIYVIGGTDALRTNIGVQAYDTEANTWETGFDPLPSALPNGIGVHGCGAIGRAIYVFGGGDPVLLTPFDMTFKFEPTKPSGSQWTQLPFTMNHARGGFGYVTDPGSQKIYAAGGSDTIDPLGLPNEVPYVEVFSPATGWSALPNLPVARAGPALFLDRTRTKLLIAGGGVLSPRRSTAFCTLPACSTWTPWTNMIGERSAPGYVGIRNRFFVAGGVDVQPPFNIIFLDTVELGP